MTPQVILLAEDDADDRSFFLDFLAGRPDISRIILVENGEQVFTFLNAVTDDAELPDVIILDQNMPRKNGMQALMQLKDHERFSKIQVVMYSTYADETLARQSLEAGAALVLNKPASQGAYHEMMDIIFQALVTY